jgi:hypothetical protein
LDLRGKKQQEAEEDHIMRSLTIFALYQKSRRRMQENGRHTCQDSNVALPLIFYHLGKFVRRTRNSHGGNSTDMSVKECPDP